jgi:hypothetical protein
MRRQRVPPSDHSVSAVTAEAVSSTPTIRSRIIVAVAIGVASGFVAYLLHARPGFWADFAFLWTGARVLLAGGDPYVTLPNDWGDWFDTPLLYPLPTVLLAVPVARFSLAAAGGIVMGFSAALLAFVLSRNGWHRLWMLASAPFVMALNLGQWSPLVTVAALEPALGALATLKPNLGLMAFAYRPSWRMVISSAVVLIISVVILPAWPLEWLHNVRSLPGHPAPVVVWHGVGFVLLLAALRWRTREARLLLVSACLPQLLLFSDQLPLMLAARTRKELILMTALSQLAFIIWFATLRTGDMYVLEATPYVFLSIFIPALVIILRRPNVSQQPD